MYDHLQTKSSLNDTLYCSKILRMHWFEWAECEKINMQTFPFLPFVQSPFCAILYYVADRLGKYIY